MKHTLLQTLVEAFLAEDHEAAKEAVHHYSLATARKLMSESNTSVKPISKTDDETGSAE